MGSSFDRPTREVVSLGPDGIWVYRESILAGFTLGPFWNCLSLDDFLLPANVPRLLVRRKAYRTRDRADVRRHLEIFRSIGRGWRWDCSDHQDDATFCDGTRCPR